MAGTIIIFFFGYLVSLSGLVFSSIHVVHYCGSRKCVDSFRLVGVKESFVIVFNVTTMVVSEDQDLIMFIFVGHHFNLLDDIIGHGKWC